MGGEVLEGEVVDEAAAPPREGTQAWLQLQEHVLVLGRELPRCHRLDLEHGQLLEAEDDGRCQYVRPEKGRCGAPRLPQYGVCIVHAGGGNSDVREMGRRGAAAQARLKATRRLLAISPGRAADPRQMARMAAQGRADEIATALLAPLDDEDLSSLAQQRSAVTILDSLWPQETVQLTVEMPADAAGVQALGWAEMQQLAAQLLRDTSETEELEPA